MEKILVTGGAGYIGSTLVQLLLNRNYEVRVLDSLAFGGESIMDLLSHEHFNFIKGDIREEEVVDRALHGMDHVVHLAAVVGDPACAGKPECAREVNMEASKMLCRKAAGQGLRRFVFASTCSNYGKMEGDAMVDEESPLEPVSLYAETKVETERFLLDLPNNSPLEPVSLRFATVYGLSRRPRFDLTVNEFTKELALGRELVVYGEQFWRPYCHVADLARSVIRVLRATREEVSREVFNVGSTEENYTKQMLVDEMCRQMPESRIRYVHKEEDPRDYRVDFSKIEERLDFNISRTVPEGIAEIRTAVQEGLCRDPDLDRYRNS